MVDPGGVLVNEDLMKFLCLLPVEGNGGVITIRKVLKWECENELKD